MAGSALRQILLLKILIGRPRSFVGGTEPPPGADSLSLSPAGHAVSRLTIAEDGPLYSAPPNILLSQSISPRCAHEGRRGSVDPSATS